MLISSKRKQVDEPAAEKSTTYEHSTYSYDESASCECDSDQIPNKVIKLNEPTSPEELPLPAGICTMLRLPWVRNSDGLDACFVGIPIDHGTSYKTGSRLAPRHIRMESAHIRKFNVHTGADPFSSIQVADIGDISVNMYNLKKCCEKIREQMDEIIKNGCRPLVMGGDHTLSYPFLQSLANRYGPVAMVHVDSHSDCTDSVSGEKIMHGTPFKRAIDENLLVCDKVFQIGIRGCLSNTTGFEFQRKKGFHIIPARDCWYKSLAPLMEEVREVIGDAPTYMRSSIRNIGLMNIPKLGLTTDWAIHLYIHLPNVHLHIYPSAKINVGATPERRHQICFDDITNTEKLKQIAIFDIDGLDPSCAPGTAFREIGGLTTSQAQEIIQGCRGLNVVGADMVEVCPTLDIAGMTSETAARLLFEILCILPGVKYHEIKKDKEKS